MAVMKNHEEEQAAIGAGLVAASLAGAGAIAKDGTVSRLVNEGARNAGQDAMVNLGKAAAGLVMAAGPVGLIAAGVIGGFLIWNALDS